MAPESSQEPQTLPKVPRTLHFDVALATFSDLFGPYRPNVSQASSRSSALIKHITNPPKALKPIPTARLFIFLSVFGFLLSFCHYFRPAFSLALVFAFDPERQKQNLSCVQIQCALCSTLLSDPLRYNAIKATGQKIWETHIHTYIH